MAIKKTALAQSIAVLLSAATCSLPAFAQEAAPAPQSQSPSAPEGQVIDEVIAIGPPVMMKGCAEATRAKGIRTMVSLNPVMVDGTGMCGGCRVKVGERVKFACVDGPDFDGHQVDFDDLMARLTRYRFAEREALERWQDSCRLAGRTEVS